MASALFGIIFINLFCANFSFSNDFSSPSPKAQNSPLSDSFLQDLETILQDLQLRLKETEKSFVKCKTSVSVPVQQKLKATNKVAVDLKQDLQAYIKRGKTDRFSNSLSEFREVLRSKLIHFEQLIVELEGLKKQLNFTEGNLPPHSKELKSEVISRTPVHKLRRRSEKPTSQTSIERSSPTISYHYDEEPSSEAPLQDDSNSLKEQEGKTRSASPTVCSPKDKADRLED